MKIYTYCLAAVALLISVNASAQQLRTTRQKGDCVIPFELTEFNNLSVRAVLNQRDTVHLMFHTAASAVTFTEEAVHKLHSLQFNGVDSVSSWGGGGNASRYSRSNTLQIGSLIWDSLPVWEDVNSGQHTDGKFGPDLFAGKVIEIDYEKKQLVIHTSLPAKSKNYQQLPLTYHNGMLFIEAVCGIGDSSITNRFLIHSGYAGGILFDDAFAGAHHLEDKLVITSEKQLKDSYGNILKTKKAVLPRFSAGKMVLTEVSAGFFSGALGRQKMSVMGGDVLKRFNWFINADRTYIYLKRNRLADEKYLGV